MSKIVIATTTFYKNLEDVRAQLALQTIAEAKAHNYPIVVIDYSPTSVAQALTQAGAMVHTQESGTSMGAGRRQAIQEAVSLASKDRDKDSWMLQLESEKVGFIHSHSWVVWMEPEKVGFIPCLDDMANLAQKKGAAMIIPRRNSMDSYTEFQQYAEKMGNEAFHLLTGRNLDMWFGPRVFTVAVAKFFLDYQGEYGDRWDSIFIPVVRAIKAGVQVEPHSVPFVYPPKQREAENQDFQMLEKRIIQLTSLIEAIKQECAK